MRMQLIDAHAQHMLHAMYIRRCIDTVNICTHTVCFHICIRVQYINAYLYFALSNFSFESACNATFVLA